MQTETAPQPETLTIRADFLDKMIDKLSTDNHAKGFREGQAAATALDIADDFGTGRAVHIIHAKTRRALSQEVKSRNHRSYGDNPGAAFQWTCELLRAFRNAGGTWQGVCVSATYYDV
jgi:hypothetical protein